MLKISNKRQTEKTMKRKYYEKCKRNIKIKNKWENVISKTVGKIRIVSTKSKTK